MNRGIVYLWEVGAIIWIILAGSCLHFAFELSDYWTPMALIAAVNESAWEHTKMYFWPGLLYALFEYRFVRGIANNYWIGKAIALVITPIIILTAYFSYMAIVDSPTLMGMISIMLSGVVIGQGISGYILTRKPFKYDMFVLCCLLYSVSILSYSTLTYIPPRIFVFEHFVGFEYTGEYGILHRHEH